MTSALLHVADVDLNQHVGLSEEEHVLGYDYWVRFWVDIEAALQVVGYFATVDGAFPLV